MTYVVVCDVCESTVTLAEWRESPGLEMKIPESMTGEESGKFTICSWECVRDLAEAFSPSKDKPMPDEVVPESLREEVAARAPELRLKARKTIAPDEPTASNIPIPGLKVDGRYVE